MKEFDDIIRGKLANLPSEGIPDWDRLKEQIDGESFDSLLRAGMVSPVAPIEPNVVPMVPGWDMLNDKLNVLSDADGDTFDQLLSRRLADAETMVSPTESWQQLAHRMDTFWTVRRKLVRYRVIELAIAASLFFTFAPLLRDNPVSPTDGVIADTQATTADEMSAFLSPEEIQQLVDVDFITPTATASTAGINTNQNSKNTTPFDLLKNAFDWMNSQVSSSAFAKTTGTSIPQISDVFPSDFKSDAGFEDERQNETLAQAWFTAGKLSARKQNLLPITAEIPYVAISKVKPSKWTIGASAGLNIWQIKTPTDPTYNQESFSRPQVGTTVGSQLVYSLSKKSGLSLGLFYTPISYDPEFPTVLKQNVFRVGNRRVDRAESFDAISLNILQIPVEYRHNILPTGKRVSLWAKGGLVGNFAMNTAYDLQTDFIETALVVPGEPVNGLNPSPSFSGPVQINRFSPSETKPFVLGVAEAGVKSTNTFLSARFGLEAEFEINDRLNLLGSVDYSQFLPLTEGIGPNYDKLNSLGISFGARISL